MDNRQSAIGNRKSAIPVLHFSNSLVRGGAEEHMLTLLRGLDRRSFKLHVVVTPEVAKAFEGDLPADVELVSLRYLSPGQAGAGLRLARILRERKVEILHSHLFRASLAASPVGWMCRVPLILETPHVREQWRRGWFKSKFIVDRLAGRLVHYYIAVSEANARYLAETKGLPKEKIVVIQNGCDIERFNPAHQPPPGLKRSLGFEDADPVLLVLARLEPQKGHSVLLEALPSLRREFPWVRLVCAGEGELRQDLEARTRALGLEHSVRFVGYQSNVADWLALADVVVLPSFYEGLPIAAIETLAAGKAIVATGVDGTLEIVLDGRTGLTVPPGDPTCLAGAVGQLLRSPELRARLGSAGRQWVEERFTQRRQVRETQEFYLRALEERRHAAGAKREILATKENLSRKDVAVTEESACSPKVQ